MTRKYRDLADQVSMTSGRDPDTNEEVIYSWLEVPSYDKSRSFQFVFYPQETTTATEIQKAYEQWLDDLKPQIIDGFIEAYRLTKSQLEDAIARNFN